MTQSLSHSQALLARDHDFTGRIASILKGEGISPAGEDPWSRAYILSADVAAKPGIADAYHASILSERTDGATADDVITDPMLLTAVTAAAGAAT